MSLRTVAGSFQKVQCLTFPYHALSISIQNEAVGGGDVTAVSLDMKRLDTESKIP